MQANYKISKYSNLLDWQIFVAIMRRPPCSPNCTTIVRVIWTIKAACKVVSTWNWVSVWNLVEKIWWWSFRIFFTFWRIPVCPRTTKWFLPWEICIFRNSVWNLKKNKSQICMGVLHYGHTWGGLPKSLTDIAHVKTQLERLLVLK